MIEIFAPFARRLRPMDVIRHFEGVVRGELDLRLESASASEFAANTEKMMVSMFLTSVGIIPQSA